MASPDVVQVKTCASGTGKQTLYAHLPEHRDDVAECGTGKGLYASDTGSKHYMHTYLNIGMTSPGAVQVTDDMQTVQPSQ